MRKDKFVKEVESLGYKVVTSQAAYVFVYDKYSNCLAYINEREPLIVSTDYPAFEWLYGEAKEDTEELYALITTYASTPIDERKSKGKRYFLHHTFLRGEDIKENSVLNRNKKTGRLFLDNKTETRNIQTRFTAEEVKEIESLTGKELRYSDEWEFEEDGSIEGILELAEHIISVAHENMTGVTVLELQQMLYHTLIRGYDEGLISEDNLREVYDAPFEVGEYGPVSREVQVIYGDSATGNIIEDTNSHNVFRKFDGIILDLLNTATSILIKDSQQHSRWVNWYEEVKQAIRPNPPIETVRDLLNVRQQNRHEPQYYTVGDLLEAAEYEKDNQ